MADDGLWRVDLTKGSYLLLTEAEYVRGIQRGRAARRREANERRTQGEGNILEAMEEEVEEESPGVDISSDLHIWTVGTSPKYVCNIQGYGWENVIRDVRARLTELKGTVNSLERWLWLERLSREEGI